MSVQKKTQLQIDFNFLPAVLHHGRDGYRIEYYVTNPLTDKLVRKRIRVDKIFKAYKLKRDALQHIEGMIQAINVKLRSGYNPFFEGEDSRLYEKLADVAEKFLAEKKKDLRPDTMRSYSSFVCIFCGFVNRLNAKQTASTINKTIAIRFMDYVFTERNVSNITYNNYLKCAKAFFNWCIEKSYAKENPFMAIKSKRKEDKKRILIPQEKRQEISEYLRKNKPGMLLLIYLEYYSLIRPKEIRFLKVSAIDYKNHCIKIDGSIAKNHNTRYAAMTLTLEKFLLELKINEAEADDYIVGRGYIPGKIQLPRARLIKDWEKVREKLNLQKEMQLYSFRDTGITEMLRAGIPEVTVMQHADHSDLSITSIYAKHADPNLIETIRSNVPEF
ncbi:MAG: tyrosine-type recombinase/integrase [Bacteroidales bacterium]|nr:tyrosine-type recombinase/integrase [Bacteroidales bacterium]